MAAELEMVSRFDDLKNIEGRVVNLKLVSLMNPDTYHGPPIPYISHNVGIVAVGKGYEGVGKSAVKVVTSSEDCPPLVDNPDGVVGVKEHCGELIPIGYQRTDFFDDVMDEFRAQQSKYPENGQIRA
jgi:hypothetical protein